RRAHFPDPAPPPTGQSSAPIWARHNGAVAVSPSDVCRGGSTPSWSLRPSGSVVEAGLRRVFLKKVKNKKMHLDFPQSLLRF
ncbi:Hypothetical predicted protein, partial [Marmota monax]